MSCRPSLGLSDYTFNGVLIGLFTLLNETQNIWLQRLPLTSPRDNKVSSLLVYGLLSGEELIAEFAKVVVSSL